MNERGILKNKYFLYVTEFFAGMSVMAIELGASRLLAPYFSSSQIVWTIIIGTIMIAMAAGNVWGGRMADKDPNPDRLYRRMIISALYIGAIPFLGKYVILAVSGILALFVTSNFLPVASFVSCMILFVYPLLLLGTVTPSLVKYTNTNLDDTGKTVGTLGGLNTIGSILGTFAPTFITIPLVGTSATFIIFASILLGLSLVYFLFEKRKRVMCIVATVVMIGFSVFSSTNRFAFWESSLIYEGESLYNYLQVKESTDKIVLSTNVMYGVQSVKMKTDHLTGMYYDYALAGPYFAGKTQTEPMNILILGLGSGTYASQCTKYFNHATVDGVEIDEKIAFLAKKYFDMPSSVNLFVEDGRSYLTRTEKKYDVILVDAYQDITIPFQMSSVEFFEKVKEKLSPNGVMVVNMNMSTTQKGSINEYLMDTIAHVFSQVYSARVDRGSNQEVFASNNEKMIQNMEASYGSTDQEELVLQMDRVKEQLVKYKAGNYLLTDDKAPVELLGMKVIDEMIQSQLDYYRGIVQREGIGGLLKEL